MTLCESHTRAELGSAVVLVRCSQEAVHTLQIRMPTVQGAEMHFPVRVCASCVSAVTGWH